MPSSRTVVVRSGKHPHEIALLIMSVVLGIIGLVVSDSISPGISNVFPGATENYFYVGVALSGSVALYGALQRTIFGLLVERAGLLTLTVFYFTYAVAVLSNSGLKGLTPALFGLAIAIANVVRLVQIQRDVKLFRKTIAEVADEGADD